MKTSLNTRRETLAQQLTHLDAAASLAERRRIRELTRGAYRTALLDLHEAGATVMTLAAGTGRSHSTISTLLTAERTLRETA